MAIDYHKLKHWQFPQLESRYDERDCMLYALGIGVGAAATAADEDGTAAGALRYVYENDLQVMPSMAVILSHPGLWMGAPEVGVNLLKVVHGEQRLRLHRALPTRATIVATPRLKAVIDKGRDKGALLIVERELRDSDGVLYATIEQTSFCRGDGGFSAQGQPSDETPPALPAVPQRAPDLVCDLPTRPEMALIYRLSSDRNPLHADPQTARSAGFPNTILHGLATYGLVCHALVRSCCNYEAGLLRAVNTRFSAPVYPGETIRTEIWREGAEVHFQSRALGRDQLVLSNGTAEIAAP